MATQNIKIVPYTSAHLDAILELSMRAWGPVFPLLKDQIPDYVFTAFYPEGWRVRQHADIAAVCNDNETRVWVSHNEYQLTGFVGLRVHEEDDMGEIYVIAVHPNFQRQGICDALLSFSFDWLQRQKLSMVMVETGGDNGHSAARAAYEKAGFERYPGARYFRRL